MATEYEPIDVRRLLDETFLARVEHHPSLTSTNDRARECALEKSSPMPLLIVADEQTNGRGRQGNHWWTGRGSLALSLLIDARMLVGDRPHPPLVSLAAAVAIVETVAPQLAPLPVGLHWPNDVFASDRKLSGVLVETLGSDRLIIGIGLNLNNTMADAPIALHDTAVTMRDLTSDGFDPTRLTIELIDHLERLLDLLSVEPEAIAARANGVCLQRGQTLQVETGGRWTIGQCEGILPDGSLQLETADGLRNIKSGVVHRPPIRSQSNDAKGTS